jgi:hypothetical protein
MDTLCEIFGYDIRTFSCCSEIVKARPPRVVGRKVSASPVAPAPPREPQGQRSPRRNPLDDKAHDILVGKMQEVEAADHRAALLLACASGDTREAQRLLREKGAHLPAAKFVRDDRGLGPVHFACAAGSLPIVKLLCEPPHNVDPMEYAPSAAQKAPVMLAARHGRVEVLEYLADTHGALKALHLPSSWSEWSSVLPEVSGREGIESPLLPVLSGTLSITSEKHRRISLRLSDAAERRRTMRQLLQQRLRREEDLNKKKLPRIPSYTSTDTGGSLEERSLSRTFMSRDSSQSRSQSQTRSPEPEEPTHGLRDKRGLNGLAVLTSSDVCAADSPRAKREKEKPKRRRSLDKPPAI